MNLEQRLEQPVVAKATIRRAEKRDCPRLMELIKELAVYEKAPEEVTVSLKHFEHSGFGANPVWWAFVAEVEDAASKTKQVVGFAIYYIRYSTWKGQRMYLEDIIVTEKWRCHGIGTRLFNTLVEEAKERGLNAICWQVLEWNEPAITFYKKFNSEFDGEWLNGKMEIAL